MNKREIFIKAKTLVTKPKSWIKGYYAKNNQGFRVFPTASEACCFCMLGAVLNVIDSDYEILMPRDLFRPVFDDIPEVVKFNDSATHKQVLAKFDELIEANS